MWSCVQCKANYDLDEIEQSLIDAVERKSMGYVLQDLKCTKCNGVLPKLFDCEKFKEITLMHLTILSINVRLARILVFFENSLFDRAKLG